ncbi:DNA-binding protein [Pseudomonas aeruginosa]|uniref:DNA-binding protein n=1 Tax=Pseudomonas aeruginosa TaxID=287 RepID=UPI000FC410F2|nr:DNA-binding protein [Pseudomonas aeruginosa]RUI34572.1 transposase [Pseudomonas aeruginosa]
MSDWFSPQQLAGLPGLGSTERAIQLRAKREGWASQRRVGTKATEYHISSLPEATRDALLKQAVKAIAAQAPAAEQLPVVRSTKGKRAIWQRASAEGALTHRQTFIRDARQLVVNALQRMQGQGMSQRAACTQLLTWAASGELDRNTLNALAMGNSKSRAGLRWDVVISSEGFPTAEVAPGQDVQRAACMLSCRTLERWLEMARDGGADGLAPGKREKDMSIHPWVPYLLAKMQRPQKPPLTDAWRQMCRELPPSIPAPSYDTVYRWYSKKFSNLDKKRGRHQGSALNPHKYARTRTSEGMVPMLEVHSDGWGTHFTAPHPVSGKYVKLEVWHTHDVATRYVFRPSVGLSESTLVIMGSLFNAVAEGGVPAVWQTDNTGSVKNDRVSFDPAASLQARTGIHITHNTPGNSQANGICENFNKYLDSRARELATYMGKDMDSLAQKRVLKLTQKLVKAEEVDERRRLKAEAEKAGSGILVESFEQAKALVEQWCDEFNQTPHSALPRIADPLTGKRRHQTPAEAWAEHVANGWQPVAVQGEALRDLFRPHERRTVRRALVNLYSQKYHHPELEHWNGEEVQIAYDIHDGERVWVKSLSGQLICEAKLDSTTGYRAQSVYEMAMEKRADAAIARHEAHIAEIDRQRPVHVITHEAPLTIPGLGDITPERLSAQMAKGALIEGQAERVVASPEPQTPPTAAADPQSAFTAQVQALSEFERYQFYRELEGRQAAGNSVSEHEAKFLRLYPQSKSYKAFRRNAIEAGDALRRQG